MPEIRLQEYTAKIKDLIHNDLHDEAIAHCQHILRRYPKHIETYSLLGEACLEKELAREAIEFFQRTLSADPESFIARVGLGIIYDAQGAFPEAIWQFERAFELAPGNSEVRRELQRLYAQRDGVEKTRLKLTRGALGRLYSRNGMYERAITEFHAVLREEADLPDIRVALAEALWREGRRLEAVETCLDILEALPNCLKANLILGEIWVRGGHEDAGEEKLRLARELDPENLLAQELMDRESPLPPEEVYLEEWTEAAPGRGAPFAAGEEILPAVWGAEEERAVDLVGGTGREEWETGEVMPDWMQEMGMAAAAATRGDLETEEAEEGSEVLPDWLQALMGDELPSVAEPAAPVAARDWDTEEQGIETGEIPAWLRGTDRGEEEPAPAPTIEVEPPAVVDRGLEALEEPPLAGAETPAAAVPESLRALVEAGILDESDVASAMAEMSPAEIEAQRAEEVPGWLRELIGEEAPVEAAPPMAELPGAEEVLVAPPVEEVPDWLRELGAPSAVEVEAEAAAVAPVEAEEVPDWLRELGEPAAAEVEAGPATVAPIEAEEELPDWLRELGAPAAVEVEAEAAAVAPVEAEEVPDWLRELGAPTAVEVEAEAAAVAPVEAEEEVPDWLRELGTPAAAHVEAEPVVSEAEEELPDWLHALDAVAQPEQEVEAGPPPAAVPESLRALVEAGILDESDVASAMAEMSPAEIEAQRAEAVPDWLRELIGEEAPPVPGEEAPVEAAPPMAELPGAEEVLVAPPVEEVPDWLRELAEPAAVAQPEQEAESGLAEEVEAAPPPAAVPESLRALVEAGILDEADVASAMAEMSPEEIEAQRAEEVPDWLRELMGEEAVASTIVEIEVEPEAAVEAEAPAIEELTVEPAVPEFPGWAIEEEAPHLPVEEELPDWLRELAAETREEEELLPAALEIEEPREVEEVEEPAPEVLAEEALPEVEAWIEVTQVEMPAPEEVPPDEEAPPEIEEWVEVTEVEAVEAYEEPAPAVPEPELDLAAQVEAEPGNYQARLELARSQRQQGQWKAAIDQYERLVSAQKLLPAVLEDLRSLLDQDVERARVYQLMGDAYMHQDQLDDALGMYRQARKALLSR